MLMIIDSMELSVFANIVAYTSAKKMWDHNEILCEGHKKLEKKKDIYLSRGLHGSAQRRYHWDV